MKSVHKFLSLLLLVTLHSSLQAASPASAEDYPMKAEKVSDGIYAIISPAISFPDPDNKGWNSNTAIVETDEGLLVFDTGSSETIGKALINTIRTVSDQPIRWVINSHSHGDHWLGNGAFATEQPEAFIASDIAIELMHQEGLNWVDRMHNMTEGATGNFKPLPADSAVTKAMEREFGGVKVQVLLSKQSHSPGDMVFWLPEKQVLLTGDVLFNYRAPATFDSHVPQWLAFLEEMQALQPAHVIPGHGPVGDAKALARLQAYFTILWEMVQAGYEEGEADFEMAPRIKEEMHTKLDKAFPNMDDRLGTSISHVYLQVEAAEFE